MHRRFKKPRPRLTLQMSDGPPAPTPSDVEFARNNRTPEAIDATSESLQPSKKNAQTPSLSEIIEHKTREHGRLMQQLIDLRANQEPNLYLVKDATIALERFQRAIIEHQKRETEIENRRVNR